MAARASSIQAEEARFQTPSPQPTHLSYNNGKSNRISRADASGYVAPAFEGKEKQMEEGWQSSRFQFATLGLRLYLN